MTRPVWRRRTLPLLLGGVLGPILFVVVDLIGGITRPGYDPARHFVSVLSLGPGGWVQASNFVAAGLLIAAFGVGLRQVPGDGHRWVGWLITVEGLALVWSGLFAVDPQWGYPVWISAEAAANPTWHDRLHIVGGITASTALPMAIFLEARYAARAGASARASYAGASATIMLGCFLVALAIGGPRGASPFSGLFQRASIVGGFQWLVLFAVGHLRLASRQRTGAPSSATAREASTSATPRHETAAG